LGDPIEAKALGTVLAIDRPLERPCALGSVKTNIGHLEAAAGVAGLIKVALALKQQEIPPSLHFQEPNPYIPFNKIPLRVQTTLGPWPTESGPALAG
jgi:acyl transferase domain-containing protein